MVTNTHGLKFEGPSKSGNYENLMGVSWTGQVPNYISSGKSGVSFSFAMHTKIGAENGGTLRNEAYTIVISMHGTTVDNERWTHEITLPFTNMGRVPFKFSPSNYEFSRSVMAMDPGVWATRPELIQEFIDGDYTNIGFAQFVPTYFYASTDSRGNLVSHQTHAITISKELYNDPDDNGPTGTEILQNRISAPLFSYKNGDEEQTYPGWLFIAGHIGDHGDGFISINGEKTYFTYGDATIDVSEMPESDRLETWKNSFASLAPGTLHAGILVKPCIDSRFVQDRTVSVSLANVWIGITELYEYQKEWIAGLYDQETGRTLDCGDGSMVFSGPKTIKPILYLNPSASDTGLVNKVDGSVVKVDSVSIQDLSAVMPGIGSTKFELCKPVGHPEVKRGECLIITDPRFSNDEEKDVAYYESISDENPGDTIKDDDGKMRPWQSILPLPTGHSYNQFFMAAVVSKKCNIKFVIYNGIDTIGDGRIGHQIGSRTSITIKGGKGSGSTEVSVNHVFDQGDPVEQDVVYYAYGSVPDGGVPNDFEAPMELIMIFFNSAKDNFNSTYRGAPELVFECGTTWYLVRPPLEKKVIQPRPLPHYSGSSIAISMIEQVSPTDKRASRMGGVWLYSQDIIVAHPEVAWHLPNGNNMETKFMDPKDNASPPNRKWFFKDTGKDGSGALGFKPALYIDPSVGLHCNSAYNAMQIGDNMYPYYLDTPDITADTTPVVRPSFASSSCSGTILKHIVGLASDINL